jgi:D-aspartate ligase
MDTASHERRTAFVLSHESDPRRKNPSTSLIALALSRSLGRSGIPVVRVHPNRLDDSLHSRYCRQLAISPDQYDSESALLDYLLKLAEDYPGTRVLIPASDDTADFTSRHRDELSSKFQVMVASPEVMAKIHDKRLQVETARSLGVPTPETHFPATQQDVRTLAGTLCSYPYIIKPLVAQDWRHVSQRHVAGGRKAIPVTNAAELVDAMDNIEHPSSVMIQEVVPGGTEGLLTFLGYFDGTGKPVAYCLRKKVRQQPPNFGYCTYTISCHNNDVCGQAIRLLSGIKYEGLVGVEFKLDARTGEYKLIEINPRAVNTISLATSAGVDLPLIGFNNLLSGTVPAQVKWESGVKWVWVAADFWAVRALLKSGDLKLSRWLRSVIEAKSHPLFAPDDLVPWLRFYRRFIAGLVRGRMSQAKR